MSDQITVVGVIGTDPEHKHSDSGDLTITTFRLASSRRRRNDEGKWEDLHTNWYTVTCFRNLATNVKASLAKGHRVMVQGRLQIREFQRDDNSNGKHIEILANHVGPDLSFATATVSSNARQREEASAEAEQLANESDAGFAAAGAGAQAAAPAYEGKPF